MSGLGDPIARVLGEVERLEREKTTNAVLRDVNTVTEPVTALRIPAAACGPSGALGPAQLIELAWHVRQLHLLEYYDVDLAALGRRWGAEWVVQTAEARIVQPMRPLDAVSVRTRLVHGTPTTCRIEAWFAVARRLKGLVRLSLVHRALATGEEVRPIDQVVALHERVRVPSGAEDLEARCAEVARLLRSP